MPGWEDKEASRRRRPGEAGAAWRSSRTGRRLLRELFFVLRSQYTITPSLWSAWIVCSFPSTPDFIISSTSDRLCVMLTCLPPNSLLHVAREVIITAAVATIPSLGWGRGRRGWMVDGGGCHGNCESVAGSTSSVVARCGAGTWIFELYGPGQTNDTHTALRTSSATTSDGSTERSLKGEKEGGKAGVDGWMDGGTDGWRKGGVTNRDWQTSILSRVGSVWLSV